MPKPAGKRSQGDFRLSPCPDNGKIGCILWNVDPGKPSRVQELQWLLEHTIRARLPSRVLVVDDSSTMRIIVRKALAATRFPFHVSEADNGAAALKLAGDGDFDIVFLDYNICRV